MAKTNGSKAVSKPGKGLTAVGKNVSQTKKSGSGFADNDAGQGDYFQSGILPVRPSGMNGMLLQADGDECHSGIAGVDSPQADVTLNMENSYKPTIIQP